MARDREREVKIKKKSREFSRNENLAGGCPLFLIISIILIFLLTFGLPPWTPLGSSRGDRGFLWLLLNANLNTMKMMPMSMTMEMMKKMRRSHLSILLFFSSALSSSPPPKLIVKATGESLSSSWIVMFVIMINDH